MMLRSRSAGCTTRGIAYEFFPADPAASEVGDGLVIVMAHANGFCKEVFSPVIDCLSNGPLGRAALLSVDLTGHGASVRTGSAPFEWTDFAADVLSCLEAAYPTLGSRPPRVLGLGHSIGGTGLLLTEVLAPGTFWKLVVVEPIVPVAPFVRNPGMPFVKRTMRRRATFASRAAALESWGSKTTFARWTPSSMRAYAEGGLVEEAGEFRLSCSPAFEAEVFSGTSDLYDRIAEVRCPTKLVAGADSTHLRGFALDVGADEASAAAYLRHLAGMLPRSLGVVELSGCTHFPPMEAPQVVAEICAGVAMGAVAGGRGKL